MSSRLKTSSDKEVPSTHAPPLVSPTRPAGPQRRPPSHQANRKRDHPESFRSQLRDCGILLLVFLFVTLSLVLFLVMASLLSTSTVTFGYEWHELPEVASQYWKELRSELLPAAWTPKIGRQGKAFLGTPYRTSTLDYGSLPEISQTTLAEHDGGNPVLPIYVSITGLVFDVTTGSRHYRKGASYNFLSGKDATVSFVTGCFSEDCFKDQKVGWDAVDAAGARAINDWVISYKEKYTLIGRVTGIYELYHTHNPAHQHQKYFTPLDFEVEAQHRHSSSHQA